KSAGDAGIHVILDYLWGRPAEAAIAAVTRRGLTHTAPRVRLVQVGESAGATLALPASVLRSSGLEICGSGAGTVPLPRILDVLPAFLDAAASGALRVDVEEIPLADVESAWRRAPDGRRIVLVP